MPRKAATSSVTINDLTFRPVPRRQRMTPEGVERYWQGRRYLGLDEQGKYVRLTVWTGWARQDQLVAIAASLVPGGEDEPQPAPTPGIASLAELRRGDVETLLCAWRGDRSQDPDLSSHTKTLNRTTCERIIEAIGSIRLRDVDVTTVEHLRRALRAGYAISSTKQTLITLGAAWNWARRRGIVDQELDLSDAYKRLNAARKRGENTGERERMVPEDDAVWTILDTIDEDAPRWAGMAFRLYLLTGARPGDLASVTWRDLDGEAAQVQVARGKTGARVIPVDRKLLHEILAARPETAADDDRVLPRSARNGFSRYLNRACEIAEVPRITPTAMRRYAVRSLVRSGVPVKAAAEIMGHSVMVMLGIYEQVTEADKAEAVIKAALGVRPGSTDADEDPE